MAMAKPQDFLIGIRDFFAVLVPGAVFLLLLTPRASPAWHSTDLLTFAIAAYLAGSVASALGSLMDFPVDRLLRSKTFRGLALQSLGASEGLASAWREALLEHCPLKMRAATSHKSFWWSYLRLSSPAAMVELDRIEATQKLFRSLVPVFLILAGLKAFPLAAAWLKLDANRSDRVDLSHLLVLAAVSFLFYVGGRYGFLSALYRLSAASCVLAAVESGKALPEEATEGQSGEATKG